MNDPKTPARPQSDEEWEAHRAFYRLAISERDAARTLLAAERLERERLEGVVQRYESTLTRLAAFFGIDIEHQSMQDAIHYCRTGDFGPDSHRNKERP